MKVERGRQEVVRSERKQVEREEEVVEERR